MVEKYLADLSECEIVGCDTLKGIINAVCDEMVTDCMWDGVEGYDRTIKICAPFENHKTVAIIRGIGRCTEKGCADVIDFYKDGVWFTTYSVTDDDKEVVDISEGE